MQLLESVVYSNVKSSEPLQSWRANMEIGMRKSEEEEKYGGRKTSDKNSY